MASVNANSLFLLSKRTSLPVVKVPRNVRDALNIAQIEERGFFKLEPGMGMRLYDACYLVSDINYINKDEEEKNSILLSCCKWLNSMNVDFKFVCANEHIDGEKSIEMMYPKKHELDYPIISAGMRQWIDKKAEEGNPDICQKIYLIISCRAQSFQEAMNYFKIMDTQLKGHFAVWKSNIVRLDAKERLRSLHSFFRMGRESEFEWNFAECIRKKQNWKNDILPTSIEQHKGFLVMDKKYVCVLYCQSMKNSINVDKAIPALTRTGFPSMVTLDIAPIEREHLMNKLNAIHTNNDKSIADEINRKKNAGQYASAISSHKERRKDEMEDYIEQIQENDENGFFLGLLVTITADSEEELDNRVRFICAAGRREGLMLEVYNYRQLKALNTALPFAGRQVNNMRCMLTTSLVGLHPYYAQDLNEEGGMIYGTNENTKQLIYGNRKKLASPHGFIIGHTGSGKSVILKLTEIDQTLLGTNDDILIIDPKKEMKELIIDLGGSYFDFSPKSKLHMNPFEIPKYLYAADKSEKEKFISDESEFAVSFCASIMKNIVVTQEHISLIGRCVRKMYDKAFKFRQQVTLKDLRGQIGEEEQIRFISEKDREILHTIYNSLEEYTEGAYDMFAYRTNIELENRLIGFGLFDVPETVWEPAMLLIMNFLNNRVKYNHMQLKATHFIVDESQTVCERETSAAQLLRTVELFRSLGAIVTLAAQNLTRILENPELRDMLSNCGYKCFLDQGGVDANALMQIQKLSTYEYEQLKNDEPGKGIMVWGNNVIVFNALLDKNNPLYAQVNTDMHEKAANRKEDINGTKESKSDSNSGG